MKVRILILIIISFAIYSNSLFNSFVWVDHTQIIQKEHIIQDLNGLVNVFSSGMPGFSSLIKGGYYRPIINLAYSIDYWIWGLNPPGFHLTNVLLHTLTGILLYFVLIRMLAKEPVAFLSVVFFLAHPIHTEAVSWISGRADMVFTLFYLLSLMFYLKACTDQTQGSSKYKHYLISGLFFIFSLLSKEMAITLPLIIILYDICFRFRDKLSDITQAARGYIFYFGILGGYLLFRYAILGGVGSGQGIPGNSFVTTFFTTSRIFAGYIWQLLFPAKLAVADVVRLANTIMDPSVIGSVLVLLLLIVAGFLFLRSLPDISFGIFWFFVTLIPVSNFVPALHLRAERFLYIPSIGFCIILASLLWGWYALMRTKGHQWRWVVISTAIAITIAYGVLTFDRNFDWKNDITIFSDAIRKSPYTREAYVELGVTYREIKKYKEAERAFLAAIEEREGYASFVQPQVVRQNLAEIYLIAGQPLKAVEHLLWLTQYFRNSYEFQRDLGIAYMQIGRPEWANVKFRQALSTAPPDPRLMDIFQRAIRHTESAPGEPESDQLQQRLPLEMIHYDLGTAHLQLKEYNAAISAFSIALSINPDSINSRLGITNARKEMKETNP
ncbi:MAG: hypothetical protein A2132_02680 [Nitrospirae bacterium RBG_16_43_11]|nr:MAG: hypothetical protein A2132_02680 [Nitrospirae bacterium RBG_16_43_11]